MEDNALSLLATFFGAIWQGLEQYNVPGTDWSFAGFLIAIFTAGIIGKILKALFLVFESHFDSNLQSGRSSGKRNGRYKED